MERSYMSNFYIYVSDAAVFSQTPDTMQLLSFLFVRPLILLYYFVTKLLMLESSDAHCLIFFLKTIFVLNECPESL